MEDYEVCHCMEVQKSEIVKAIKEYKLTTSEQVSDITDAGTVCGECIPEIEEIIEETLKHNEL